MRVQQLKQYLEKLSKEEVIDLYLQQRDDKEIFRSEILTNIYNQIIDIAHHQLNMFDSWDMIIPQRKFRAIFNKGGDYEDPDIT